MFSLPVLPLARAWREVPAEGKGLVGNCYWEAFGKPLSCLGEHRESLGSSSAPIQDWDVLYSRRERFSPSVL